MSVILYARVSTGQQAEKELSIPAQINAMKRYAQERKLSVSAVYQDVASGYSLAQRPGLVTALRQAARDKSVNALLVHKVDRLSRNTYQYLTIKGQLRTCGVSIVSVVEHFENNPMGEFIEHIMAAQAEFYSANLSFEVKKGLEERLRRGRWNGPLPVGYIKHGDKVRLDPARAEHVRFAFERWSTGTVTSTALATELFERGLVARNGGVVRASKLCDILKNPFYAGIMKTASGEHLGLHPHLVSRELFERCLEIFKQKGNRGMPRRHLTFLLSGLLRCPKCDTLLVGERHSKKSGKVFKYYRCHQKHCSFCVPTSEHEARAVQELLQLDLPGRLLPALRLELKRQRRKRDERQVIEVRALRQRLREIDAQKLELARRLANRFVDDEDFEQERKQMKDAERLTRWILANKERDVGDDDLNVRAKVGLIEELKNWDGLADDVERKRVFSAFVERVDLGKDKMVQLRTEWKKFDNSDKVST